MRASLNVAAVIVGTLAVVGCGQMSSPTSPTLSVPSLTPSVSAGVSSATIAALSASASTDVFTIPASVRVSPGTKALIESCLGEAVTFVGDGLLVIHRTTLPNGSRVLVVHANPQGAVAVGASSGLTYRIAASDGLARVVAPSGTFVATFTANLNVVGPGGSSGFFGHIILHVSVTPDGDVTADIEIVDIDCR